MSTRTARSQRPQREPAPPLLDVLDQMHQRILGSLAELQQLVERAQREGADVAARNDARALRAFFNEHARQHHASEESEVFPALLDSGDAELVGHVQRLQQDHGWLDVDWYEIDPMLDAFAEGIGTDLEALRVAVQVYADLYRDHISLEENVVYPRAREIGVAASRR
ncbi:MAG TPA: hemerythrin domain-containing protein [Povalibacter sp.]|uniref:hemerythrin domain-containing protein n=1 Tax=Povalibacter sp. TaxID=1962978 RepID=UPI002B878433|nr:hemerythrin domain-containing protein [Povalibacter sp.]HMN47448.1 hemerythrin domain-containing protein [Povalibacter sp.]